MATFDPGMRPGCSKNAMTGRQPLNLVFLVQNMKNPLAEFPRHFKVVLMRLEDFAGYSKPVYKLHAGFIRILSSISHWIMFKIE